MIPLLPVYKVSTLFKVTLLYPGLPIVFSYEVSSPRPVTICHVLWIGRLGISRRRSCRSRSAQRRYAIYDTHCTVLRPSDVRGTSQPGVVLGGRWKGWLVFGGSGWTDLSVQVDEAAAALFLAESHLQQFPPMPNVYLPSARQVRYNPSTGNAKTHARVQK